MKDLEPRAKETFTVATESRQCLSVQDMIRTACAEYGIDSDIPLAIARLETGHFTSEAFNECNNVGGMSIDEIPITYGSLEEGIAAFVENLADNYFGKGLDTPEEIGRKYCPGNAENWAEVVRTLIQEEKR